MKNTFRPARLQVALGAAMIALPIAGEARAEPQLAERTTGPIQLRYEAFLGPFYVMSADAAYHLADRRYTLSIKARTEGFAGWFFEWRSHVEVAGSRKDGTLRPERYRVDAEVDGEPRRVRIRYAGDGLVETEAVPPSDGEERDPVPAPLTERTIDPLTATVHGLLRLAGGQACSGEHRVFDGRRRYDLRLVKAASVTLPERSSSVFKGLAQACGLKINRIAGFWKKPARMGRRIKNPVIYLGRPIEALPPVPVRFEGEAAMGSISLHLTRVASGNRTISIRRPD